MSATPLVSQVQTGRIEGRVVDGTTMAAIVGANVVIDDSRIGTTTGADGSFALATVPVGTHVLTARFIGYAPVSQEVTVRAGETTTAEFMLGRQAVVMDEIVVTGYGAQRRAAITGSIATVNADEADVGVTTNANDLLQARVSGVFISQNHGEPGAGQQVRIRGGTSISASNQPLYVIDGVVIQNEATEPGGIGMDGDNALPRSPLNTINPNDIESITVLKDAAAAAIYGARGANGVILIETKQGQRDQSSVEYEGYVSVSTPANRLNLLSGDEYRQFVNQQIAAGVLLPAAADALGSASTNWEDQVLRTAVTHNHNLAFTGGTASTQYRASLNYMRQEGIALSSGLERIQARLNGTHFAFDDRLQFRVNLTASHIENDYVPFEDTGGFEGGVFQNTVQFNPTYPVRQGGGYFELGLGGQSIRNPVALAQQTLDFAGTTRVLGNLRTQLDVTDNLQAQLIVGLDRSESTRRIYFPNASAFGARFNGRGQQDSRELTSVTLQTLLTYTRRISDAHDFGLTGGYEFNEYTGDEFNAGSQNFLTDALFYDNLTLGANQQKPFSNRFESRLIGFFGRLTYGYQDRYFLTGVLRRDGSTKFGADNKWATFPAVSASWLLSEESFLSGGTFSLLRLRGGWGKQGNEAVPAYASLLILAPGGGDYPFGDVTSVGIAPVRAASPFLKWEETSQWNLGIDYGFNNNRVSGSFEYYVKNTSDLLLSVPVPQPAVQAERFENIGEVRNSGLEAELTALLVQNTKMAWEAGFVFSAENNEVSSLGGRSFINSGFVSGQGQSGQVSQRILEGYALGTFYGAEFVGINDAGEQLFNDYDDADATDPSGQTTSPGADDYRPIGNANPDFVLGLRSRLTIGAFDASFIARWEQGRDVFNNTALVHGAKSNVLSGRNFLRSGLDEADGVTQPAIFSSRWIEDGSFIRMQNITIGYTFRLPEFMAGSGNTARLYVSADNLFLLTGYSGYDPEVFSDAGLQSRGIDYLSYPRARTFTGGLRITF